MNPCTYVTFALGMDGDKWCALYPADSNLQEGVAGFGDTAGEAVVALAAEMKDVNWL